MTKHVVQYIGHLPFRLTWPRNFAPTTGPVAPSSHSASSVSGLYRPMLVTSLTRSHTVCGAALMWTVTESCIDKPYARPGCNSHPGARSPTGGVEKLRTGPETLGRFSLAYDFGGTYTQDWRGSIGGHMSLTFSPSPSPFVKEIIPIPEPDDEIRAALADAEVPPLLPALAYLT